GWTFHDLTVRGGAARRSHSYSLTPGRRREEPDIYKIIPQDTENDEIEAQQIEQEQDLPRFPTSHL
ncbi:MAG: hypothetical protein OES12_10310, partial [Anaerolineae bacterium]|nr:hypothetical protein [Anaerolineae bacterium]